MEVGSMHIMASPTPQAIWGICIVLFSLFITVVGIFLVRRRLKHGGTYQIRPPGEEARRRDRRRIDRPPSPFLKY